MNGAPDCSNFLLIRLLSGGVLNAGSVVFGGVPGLAQLVVVSARRHHAPSREVVENPTMSLNTCRWPFSSVWGPKHPCNLEWGERHLVPNWIERNELVLYQ